MKNYSDIFRQVLTEFESNIVPGDQGDAGKGQVLARAGLRINQFNPDIGYILKNPGQTNFNGIGVDALMDKSDGTGADFLTDELLPNGTRLIRLAYTPYAPPAPGTDPTKGWVQPTEAHLNFPGPMKLKVGSTPQPAGNAQLVTECKAELERLGVSLGGACGALKINNLVGWRRRPRYALLQKGGGNRAILKADGTCFTGEESNDSEGYATDYLIDLQDGFVGYDTLGDGGGANSPQWSGPESSPEIIARNRANAKPPIDPAGYMKGSAPVPVPPKPDKLPEPPPPPAVWSNAPKRSMQWYSEGGHTLNQMYRDWFGRDADPGGWGNWWWWIIENDWTPAQVGEAWRKETEFLLTH